MLSPKHRVFLGFFVFGLSIWSNSAWSGSSLYWPTQGWRTSTPEAQGMKSDVLAAMFTDLTYSEHSIDSVTIIRNGYIILDAYFYPFPEKTQHIRHSCTKSITSNLVGIAIDKGHIQMPRASMSGSAGCGSNRTTWPSSVGCLSTRVSGTDEWSYRRVGSMPPPGGISEPNLPINAEPEILDCGT